MLKYYFIFVGVVVAFTWVVQIIDWHLIPGSFEKDLEESEKKRNRRKAKRNAKWMRDGDSHYTIIDGVV